MKFILIISDRFTCIQRHFLLWTELKPLKWMIIIHQSSLLLFLPLRIDSEIILVQTSGKCSQGRFETDRQLMSDLSSFLPHLSVPSQQIIDEWWDFRKNQRQMLNGFSLLMRNRAKDIGEDPPRIFFNVLPQENHSFKIYV